MLDQIEISRRRAAELHSQAVARGLRPDDVYNFAKAEANLREIEVSKVPNGDVRLCGGRAVFDPDAWLILHEATGDPFMDAFLVAHEIGHVEFGGQDEPFTAHDVDPTRSSGSTGVGTDRVVDYSRRQRREVQMDLFAREFLLPRLWLRRLHVAEGQSAKAIAGMMKAPRGVVVQQLLDAVLLPMVVAEPNVEPERTHQYNAQQTAAMQYSGQAAFLLKAGPGTGKTRTLIGRIEHLVATGAAPESILVLTFSNKAAGELSDRLAIANPDAAARVWIGTFHSFGLDLIRRFHDRLDLPADPSLVDTSDAVAIVEQIYPRLQLTRLRNLHYPSRPIGQALDAISRAHDEVVNASRYRELAEAMLAEAADEKIALRAEQCIDVACMFDAFEDEKRRLGKLSFGDLVSMPVRLCEDDAEVRSHLSNLYQHVLVDEFQDVNRASVRLLKTLSPSGKNLWVVGDARQSIYRFRGASSYNVDRFCREDFPEGETGELTLNYRSIPEINTVVARFAASMSGANEGHGQTESTRAPLGYPPELCIVEQKIDEADAIARNIAEALNRGYLLRDNAVLCSGNDRLAELAGELESRGIPVLFLGNLFERDEIRDLLSLVSILVDGRAMGLLRLAAIPEFEMSITDVSSIIDALRNDDTQALQWIDGRTIEGLSETGTAAFQRLREVFSDCNPGTNPWQLLSAFLFDHTRVAADLASREDVVSRSKGIAIWQLMNFVKALPPGSGTPATRLLHRVRQLVLYSDDRELRQLPKAAERIDAVRMMTMHGSKGLESPVVHVAGLTSASIPRSGAMQMAGKIAPPDGMIEGASNSGYDAIRNGLEAEQECLFFVALSRAKDFLFLYRYRLQSGGRKQSGSRFLELLGDSVKETSFASEKPIYDDERSATSVLIDNPFRLTDYQIVLYEKCPARFLYAHVLKSGGRRTETAYMLLHDAVQDVINVLTSVGAETLSLEETERMLDLAMAKRGFDAAAAEYRSIAAELIRTMIAHSSDGETAPASSAAVEVLGGTVEVTPDQIVRRRDGTSVHRRIRTGHAGSRAGTSLEAALLHISAQYTESKAELLHLGDGQGISISMSPRDIDKKRKELEAIAQALLAGRFPIRPSLNCPYCPAYFICGKLPAGQLVKKLSG